MPKPYTLWTVAELRAKCKAKGLKTSGTKTQLIQRLHRYNRMNSESKPIVLIVRTTAASVRRSQTRKRKTKTRTRTGQSLQKIKSDIRRSQSLKRKGPAMSATWFPLGTVHRGNDGRRWKVIRSGTTKRWQRI